MGFQIASSLFQLFSGDFENGVVNLDSYFGMKTHFGKQNPDDGDTVIPVKRGFADKAKPTFRPKEAFCDVLNVQMEWPSWYIKSIQQSCFWIIRHARLNWCYVWSVKISSTCFCSFSTHLIFSVLFFASMPPVSVDISRTWGNATTLPPLSLLTSANAALMATWTPRRVLCSPSSADFNNHEHGKMQLADIQYQWTYTRFIFP